MTHRAEENNEGNPAQTSDTRHFLSSDTSRPQQGFVFDATQESQNFGIEGTQLSHRLPRQSECTSPLFLQRSIPCCCRAKPLLIGFNSSFNRNAITSFACHHVNTSTTVDENIGPRGHWPNPTDWSEEPANKQMATDHLVWVRWVCRTLAFWPQAITPLCLPSQRFMRLIPNPNRSITGDVGRQGWPTSVSAVRIHGARGVSDDRDEISFRPTPQPLRMTWPRPSDQLPCIEASLISKGLTWSSARFRFAHVHF